MSLIKHNPCGHWHKGSSKVAPPPPSLNYYTVYYGPWSNSDYSIEHMKCTVFDGAVKRDCNLITGNYGAITTFEDDFVMNMMDANNSTIACLVYIDDYEGVTKNAFACKVSKDRGVSWGSFYYFPTTTYNTAKSANVRIDANSYIWVSIYDLTSKNILLYKSIDSGDSFSVISTTAVTWFAAGNPVNEISYTIDDTGQYQYICCMRDDSSRILYCSSNYGVSFTTVTLEQTPAPYDSIIHTSNKLDVCLIEWESNPALYNGKFKVSVDGGTSFGSLVPPGYGVTDSRGDIQSSGDKIVYTDDWSAYAPVPYGLIYSANKGVSWVAYNYPVSYIPTTEDSVLNGKSVDCLDSYAVEAVQHYIGDGDVRNGVYLFILNLTTGTWSYVGVVGTDGGTAENDTPHTVRLACY